MWGEVAFAFAPSCFSREAGYIAANHPRPIKQARKSLHQALMQIISPKVLQTSTTILQLKVYISYVVQNLVGHTFAGVSWQFGFIRFPICLNLFSKMGICLFSYFMMSNFMGQK